jgi:predicted dehydrogenase
VPEALRVGIAGLGVATAQVLPGIEKMPHARIVAGADVRENALDAFRERYGGATLR